MSMYRGKIFHALLFIWLFYAVVYFFLIALGYKSVPGFWVLFGELGLGMTGLIISFVISYVVGATHFIANFFKSKKDLKNAFEDKRDLDIAKTYKNFPLASLPHALSDVFRDVLVAFIIIEL